MNEQHAFHYDRLIEQGTSVAFTRQLEVHVIAIQHCRDRETITAIVQLGLGSYFLGEVECEFPTIALLLDAFARTGRAELWEVVGSAQAGIRLLEQKVDGRPQYQPEAPFLPAPRRSAAKRLNTLVQGETGHEHEEEQ